ncbi:MAG: hypothetical protein JOS17DRAFT_786724 [Linnemannia elongata]|nr:MAG: hypothetical protein JOS17DRAFT_786724 [Linnemannia elongata]
MGCTHILFIEGPIGDDALAVITRNVSENSWSLDLKYTGVPRKDCTGHATSIGIFSTRLPVDIAVQADYMSQAGMMTSAKNPPNSIVIYGYDNLTHVPSLMPHLPFALQVSSYFQWSAQQAPVGSLPPLNPQCPVTHVRVDLGVELVDGTVGSSSYPAQEFPKLEYDLHALRLMRIAEYKQAVYINPMAKLHLQDTDLSGLSSNRDLWNRQRSRHCTESELQGN